MPIQKKDIPAADGMSRRTFIRNASMAAAAFTIVPRFVLGKGHVAPSDTLYVAGIGVGGKGETDLVMIVTPYLVKPMDPTKKPRTPADATYPASTADYFLGNQDETKANGKGELAYAGIEAQAGPAPTFGHFLDLTQE